MNRKIKISIVNYTNTLPFRWALKKSKLIDSIDLQEDIPSICAQKLKFDQVELALVPTALLNELPSYEIVSDHCIGAVGKVDSVKLYSSVPLSEIKQISLDYQSRSSIALTRILCKEFWKLDVTFQNAEPGFESKLAEGNANVVIGDRTFDLNGKFKFEYDLAEEWMKFTGLPFVFAVWASRTKMDPEFIKEFNAILKAGTDNINEAVLEMKTGLSINVEQAIDYLSNKISYSLNDSKRKSITLFLNHLKLL